MLSPAKLNLSLRLLSKRSDGFHEIETQIVKIPGLSDELTITPADSFAFSCDCPELPTDSSNLVVKAVNALSAAAGEQLNYEIFLEKRIPHGAGLGGGSSNAATTLLALNGQLKKPFDADQLHEIAAEIGSDVPFFLYDGAAKCTGRGEIVESVENPPAVQVALFKPNFSISTKDAYENCLEAEPLPGIRYSPQRFGDLEIQNDLEKAVFAKHRYLAELKDWLLHRRDTKSVLLSGSGSTIFALIHDRGRPQNLINAAQKYFDSNLWTWHGTL